MLPLPCIVMPLLKGGTVQVLVQDADRFDQRHHWPSWSRRQCWLLASLSSAGTSRRS